MNLSVCQLVDWMFYIKPTLLLISNEVLSLTNYTQLAKYGCWVIRCKYCGTVGYGAVTVAY